MDIELRVPCGGSDVFDGFCTAASAQEVPASLEDRGFERLSLAGPDSDQLGPAFVQGSGGAAS